MVKKKKNGEKKPQQKSADLEIEWKKLREELEKNSSKGKRLIPDNLEDFFSQDQPQMNIPAEETSPVLKRVENFQRNQTIENIENVNVEREKPREEEPLRYVGRGERREVNQALYLPRGQTAVEPPVLRPRDTIPTQELPRERLFDVERAMAGRDIGQIYPNMLGPEEKAETKYYKVPEDSY